MPTTRITSAIDFASPLSRPSTHPLRTKCSRRCVETTGRPEVFCAQFAFGSLTEERQVDIRSAMTREERRDIALWLVLEKTKGDNITAINHVHAALVSGERIHPDGVLWLVAQLSCPGLNGVRALRLLNEFRSCGQIVRAA